MGLSTKQVNGDGLDWNEALCQAQTFQLPKPPTVMRRQQQQQNQQQQQPEACPRCESTNTKFCYYNNYNKSQPRHFCRACKRHWTKGGTLRNVPVGGGRKNKRRIRKSNTTTTKTTTSHDSAATATITSTTGLNNTHMAIDQTDHDNMSEALYQALIRPPSSLPQQNLNAIRSSQLGNNNDMIFSSSSGLSTLPFLQSMNLRFPFSSSSTSTSFDTSLSSISTSFPSSNVYNPYCEEFKAMEEPAITTTTDQQNWKVPTTISTSSGMDIMSNDWNWEDIETLVSTDLNVPWDDSDHVKPWKGRVN